MTTRPWTEAERDYLRRHYGRKSSAEIAQALGRARQDVYRQTYDLGLSRRVKRLEPEQHEAILRLRAQGATIAEIARQLGRHRRTVTLWCRRLGLPPTPVARYSRRGYEATTARHGAASLGELASRARRAYARASGWPEDLPMRCVQILNLLAQVGVPLTKRQITLGVGLRWRGAQHSLRDRQGRRSHLEHLVSRGLVLRLPRALRGQGRGCSWDLYTLGPAALQLLWQRASQELDSPNPCSEEMP